MIDKIIKKRRSVYPPQYTKKPIDKKDILDILEAGNYAPTHKKTQPWRFKVIHTLESREKFSEALANAYKDFASKFSAVKYRTIKEKPVLSGAVIAICMKRHDVVPLWEEQAAVAMAVQNMWLVATAKQIGAYWGTPPFANLLTDFLTLEEDETCLGFFFMGHTESFPEDWERTPVADLTIWI